jgi:uncharacterized protein
VKLAGSYQFEAPVSVVWPALFDPELLARILPGCEKLVREGDDLVGELTVKMGPVQGKFQGRVQVQDRVDPEKCTLVIDSKGPAGFAKATARLQLHVENGGTRLDYDSDVTVGGKIATIGQRLIDASAKAIVKQSLEGLNQQVRALAIAPAAGSETAGAGPEAVGHAAPAEAELNVHPASSGEASAAEATASPTQNAADTTATAAQAADTPPPAMSQSAFAFGVAKELTRELLPARTLGIAAVVLVALIGLGVLYFNAR